VVKLGKMQINIDVSLGTKKPNMLQKVTISPKIVFGGTKTGTEISIAVSQVFR